MTTTDAAASLNPISHGADPTQGLASELRGVFASGRTRPAEWRRRQLEGMVRLLEAHADEMREALAADLGKPALEATTSEVAYVRSDVQDLLANLESWMRPRSVSTSLLTQPGRSAVHPEPLGVVLVIAPWNYPFTLALQPLAGAIAAGNCAVLKPSEVTPTCSALMARLLPRYVDPDAIRVVEGAVEETTELLAQRWDHIFFTGNGTVGRVVMRAAAEHLTPVVLELGGKSPCIVDATADVETAAARIAWGKFFNAGQTCVAPDYVLVERSVEQPLLEALAATVRRFYGADPKQSEDFGRIVNERHHARVAGLLGGGRPVVGGDVDAAARYIAPTVLTDVDTDHPVMAEEIFGPVLPVIAVDDVDAAIAFVNDRPKPLALYAFTTDDDARQAVLERTSSGAVVINHVWMHLANPHLPFGGVGESGMGAYHGQTSFDAFSHMKAVMAKPAGLDVPLLYPPHSRLKRAIVERVI